MIGKRVIRAKRTPTRKKEKAELPIPFRIPQFDRRRFINEDKAGSDAYVVASINSTAIFSNDELAEYRFTIRDCNGKATIHGNLNNLAEAFRAVERLMVIRKVVTELINKIDTAIDVHIKGEVKNEIGD